MMGVVYLVACTKCKVVRDLDKFYWDCSVKSRQEALELSKEINNIDGGFRSALLLSFMAQHVGHECVMFSDLDEEACEKYWPYGDHGSEYREDIDFWIENDKE